MQSFMRHSRARDVEAGRRGRVIFDEDTSRLFRATVSSRLARDVDARTVGRSFAWTREKPFDSFIDSWR